MPNLNDTDHLFLPNKILSTGPSLCTFIMFRKQNKQRTRAEVFLSSIYFILFSFLSFFFFHVLIILPGDRLDIDLHSLSGLFANSNVRRCALSARTAAVYFWLRELRMYVAVPDWFFFFFNFIRRSHFTANLSF